MHMYIHVKYIFKCMFMYINTDLHIPALRLALAFFCCQEKMYVHEYTCEYIHICASTPADEPCHSTNARNRARYGNVFP